MPKPSRTALALGATGGIGAETALALSRHGWQIRAFSRALSPRSDSPGWQWSKAVPLTEPPSSQPQRRTGHRARGEPAGLPKLGQA
jgi:NAD(P)-dependent dehydrogenase (short-subunit alcohol dehydrogenase family)